MAEIKSLAEVMKSISKKYGENIVRQGAEAVDSVPTLSQMPLSDAVRLKADSDSVFQVL